MSRRRERFNAMFSLRSPEEVAAFNASLDDWVNGVGEAVVINDLERRDREEVKLEIVEAYRYNLPYLSLFGYSLTSLPPQIGQLISLESLELSFNELRSVPPEIANLRRLKNLDIGNNLMETIPDQIFDLAALKQLIVRGNLLTEISPQIRKLTNLESVDFGANRIEVVPPEMAELRKLMYLDINDNDITTLPDFLFTDLRSIAVISVAENPIPEGELSRLRALHNSVARAGDIEFQYGDGGDEEEVVVSYNKSRFNLVVKQIVELEPDENLGKELKSWLETGVKSAVGDSVAAESPTDLACFRILIDQCSGTSSWTGEGSGLGPEALADAKNGMCKVLLQIIKAAYSDKKIANIVNETSAGSGVSCGDRVAMTLLDVQMAALHFNTPPNRIENADDLFKYAKEKSVYNFLKKKAEDYVKSKGRSKVDEVEVHLLYMQSLSNLGVEVDGLNMLYRKTISDIGDDQLRAVEAEYNGPLICAAEDAVSTSDTSLMRDLKAIGARIDDEMAKKMSRSEYLTYLTMLDSAEFAEVDLIKSIKLLTPEMVEERAEFDNCSCGKVLNESGDSRDERGEEFEARLKRVEQECLKLKILVLREVHRTILGARVEILERDKKSLEVVEREDKDAYDNSPTYINIFDKKVTEDLVRLKVQQLAELFSFKKAAEAEKASEEPASDTLDVRKDSEAYPSASPDLSGVPQNKKGASLKRARAASFDIDFLC